MKEVKKFGLEALYHHFFPDKTYPGKYNISLAYSLMYYLVNSHCFSVAHRALSDVQAMVEIFQQTDLAGLISSLPTRTTQRQLKLWHLQKGQHIRTTRLIQSLGKGVTAAQAKRLDTLGLHYDVLCRMRGYSADDEDFQNRLKKQGVHSNPLRKKLAAVVK